MDKLLDSNIEAMDGFRYVFEGSGYWYKIFLHKVKSTSARPHGVKYELTLHDDKNKRVMGFDNAHGNYRGYKKGDPYDHWHRASLDGGELVKRYNYKNSSKLIEDFFREVDSIDDEVEGGL